MTNNYNGTRKFLPTFAGNLTMLLSVGRLNSHCTASSNPLPPFSSISSSSSSFVRTGDRYLRDFSGPRSSINSLNDGRRRGQQERERGCGASRAGRSTRRGDAGTCKDCYEEANETEEELKQEIEDLKAKIAFLCLCFPLDDVYASSLSTNLLVLALAPLEGYIIALCPSLAVPAHRVVLVARWRSALLCRTFFTTAVVALTLRAFI